MSQMHGAGAASDVASTTGGGPKNERTAHSQACAVAVTAQSLCGTASYIHTVLSHPIPK